MATKYYLDQEGLERLVNYINNALAQKADIDTVIELPEDLVHEADLADFAKKSDIPESADLSIYATKQELGDYATSSELNRVEGLVNGVYHYRGSVDDLEALQAVDNPAVGDVYNLGDTGMNAAWTGSEWDEFGSIVDLSDYLTEAEVQAITISELNRILFSGKTAVVTDADSLQAMVSNSEPEVEVMLNKNLAVSSPIIVPEGKKVIIDLSNNTLSATGNNIPVYANGGEVVVKNGAVSASSVAVVVRNGGSAVVENADITSTGSNAITATNGSVTIESGNIKSQEAGVAGFKDSNITINGGVLEGLDNCPVMGNGSAAGSTNDGTNMNVVMNGGTLIAKIQSPGYAACGVYVPNSGSFTMNGGEIISDGAGLVMRGGQVNLNGGRIVANGAAGATGKVGDSRVVVGSYAVVYDANSKYPAKDTLELNIGKDMVLEGTDGDIQVLLEKESDVANINDER